MEEVLPDFTASPTPEDGTFPSHGCEKLKPQAYRARHHIGKLCPLQPLPNFHIPWKAGLIIF
jgi:hypothetical protein